MKKITSLNQLKKLFYALIGFFLLILSIIFISPVGDIFKGTLFFLAPFIIFSLLGLALLILTLKSKVAGRLRKFLILTGASATGIFIGIFLHNFIYGLFATFYGLDFWERIGLRDEPFFFFFALIICPIGFLIGALGSILLFARRKKT